MRGGGCEHAAACPSTRRQAEDARAQLLRDGARRTTQIMLIVSMTDIVPPWPNGQGVGLLIRRLRVRVPPGVICCYEILEASRPGTGPIAWSRRRSRTRHQTCFARVSDWEPAQNGIGLSEHHADSKRNRQDGCQESSREDAWPLSW